MPSPRRASCGGRDRSARLGGIFAADAQVFRFYPDGTVLDVLVRPAPGPEQAAAIARWLRPGSPPRGVLAATYALRGRRLSFTTRGHVHDGPVSVEGTWRNGALTLDLTGGGRTAQGVRFRRLDTDTA